MHVVILVLMRLLIWLAHDRLRKRTLKHVFPSRFLAVMLSFCLRGLCFSLAFNLGSKSGHWLTWRVVFFTLLVVPQAVLSGLLIPLGVPHLTYWFTRFTLPFATAVEPRGGGLFNELRARLRWGFALGANSLASMHGLVRFRGTNDRSTSGASVCVQAMLDAITGQRDDARDLFAIVQAMSWRHSPRMARCYAQAWILADAADRGAYHELIRAATRGPRTRRRWFLQKIAARLLGGPRAPNNFELTFAWLLAPARRHTFRLFKHACRASAQRPIQFVDSGLAAARKATLELERRPLGMSTRAELRALALAWQTVFESGELGKLLARRRDELQANFEPEALAARFEQNIIEILARAWRWAPLDEVPETDDPLLVLSAKDLLQAELLGELEFLCGVLPRGSAHTTGDLEHHLRTWARVRSALRAFLDALPERASILSATVGLNILNHGVWLHNKELAAILGHDVFRFLLLITPKDDVNRRLIEDNAAISS